MPGNADWQAQSAEDLIDEIEQSAAVLASVMTPTIAASELRRMADEIEMMQPKGN